MASITDGTSQMSLLHGWCPSFIPTCTLTLLATRHNVVNTKQENCRLQAIHIASVESATHTTHNNYLYGSLKCLLLDRYWFPHS